MGSGTPRPSSPGPHPRGASAGGTLALPAHARVSGGAREASAHPAAPGASGSKIKALPGRQLRFVGTVPRSAPDSRLEPPTHPLYGCDQSRPVPQPVASEASWLSPCTRKRVASRPRRMTGDFLPPLHLPGAALLLSSPPSFCTFSGHAEDPGPPARGPVPRGQPGLGRLCLWRSSESRSCLQPPPTAFTFCQTSSAAFLEPHPQTRQTH
ncbi:uncharacterized protein [Canis lupus baileyi]|uniref:dapper homolog 3-like n=1 Tax=Canis lupus familiaris TaxID=9615 RepID=UPI0018F7D0FC|nr:dapper homolog 3-like [Canis lupus familiaris]